MSTCSVIMVTYHTGPVLFASIKSVLKQRQLAELIIIDNGNPPSVLSRLQQMALTEPKLVVVTGGGNIGLAKGCNNGSAHATGKFLLMLNPDSLLPPDALVHFMQALETHPGARMAGGFLVDPDNTERKTGRRPLLTPKELMQEIFPVLRRFDKKPAVPEAMPADTHEVPAISSACLCLRAEDFRALGGMDESYFLYVEDMDLCMRVHNAGGKIICVPRVRVTRLFSTSERRTVRFVEWHVFHGRLRYFAQHFRPKLGAILILPVQAAVFARFAWNLTVGSALRLVFPQGKVAGSAAAKKVMILANGTADLPEKKDWYGKTVLVTGATGQVGLCVMKRLIASGAAVLALSRNDPIPFEHPHLRWIRGDINDRSLSLSDYLIDMVVHCAPLASLPPIIDLVAGADARRIIAFGSTSLFGKAMSKNPYERDLVDNLAKAEREIAARCQMRGIQWTVFRPTLIYGVGLDKNVSTLARMIERLRFFPLYPPAFGRRQPVHADDLAIAVMQAANNAITFGKAYNLSGGKILTYREMIEDIFAVLGRVPRIVHTTLLPFIFDTMGRLLGKPDINGEIARRMNEDLVFFHDDATKDFGFNPRPFLAGGMRDIEGF